MKENILWGLLDNICSKEEKEIIIKLDSNKYKKLETTYEALIKEVKEAIKEWR